MAQAPAKQRGASLIEAMIAILIFAFGVLALVGLQANATSAATKSKFRIDAGLLASQCIATLWLDRDNIAANTCPACDAAAAAALPGGSCTPNITKAPADKTDSTEVTVTVSWVAPGDTANSTHIAVAQISANQ
ncbi:MAG: prepilin-type N-terminal cleavage/methylation domain-containing protein [Zoogloeaceae bacterium]|jgi:type IV pilus assembly protein PilV|nr:prepilin-type N-terminal cleavage/methylation domain-containing protein [Zoogloeaceae bacterium]